MSDHNYKKNVNGIVVDMTPEEIEERKAEEAAYAAKRQKYEAEEKYKDLRRAELSPLDGEGMDAMRKALTQIYSALDYLAPPEELEEYLNKVDQIKARHPKPETVQK